MNITLTAGEAKAIADLANLDTKQVHAQFTNLTAPIDAPSRGRGHLAVTGDLSDFTAFILAASDHLISSPNWSGVDTLVEVHEIFGRPVTTAGPSGTTTYRWPNVQIS